MKYERDRMNARQPQAATAATETTERPLDAVLDQAIAQTQRTQSITATAASFLGVPPAKVCALLRNVWKTSKGEQELTDQEMFQGLSMIARFGLDPVAKEVYVTRSSKGLMTIIGIDGFVKILDRTDGYDGFEQELGWSQDGKALEWVETIIHSTKRTHPTRYKAFAEEYGKLSGIVAKSIPWHMLRLFSLRHATRLFTPIGGSVVTEEEARWMSAYEPERQPAKQLTQHAREATEALDAMLNKGKPAPESPGDDIAYNGATSTEAIIGKDLPPTLVDDDSCQGPDLQSSWEKRVRECAPNEIDVVVRDAIENDGVDVRAVATERKEALAFLKSQKSGRK